MKNIVYFDLETRRSAAQVGGWHEASKMGMSVGVTYSTKDNAYHIYTEEQVEQLIEELRMADLVVGYNHVGFDYQVAINSESKKLSLNFIFPSLYIRPPST